MMSDEQYRKLLTTILDLVDAIAQLDGNNVPHRLKLRQDIRQKVYDLWGTNDTRTTELSYPGLTS